MIGMLVAEHLGGLTPPWDNVDIVSWKGGSKTLHLPKEEQWGDISNGAKYE